MKTIFVSPHSTRADARSLSEALQKAQPDDVVLVEPGRYSPSLTGERLPLTLPPGVHVQGAARQECIIDGEGHFSPSFQPIRPEQSVVVLKDGTSLSGVTVTQGGGHGIGVSPVRLGHSPLVHDQQPRRSRHFPMRGGRSTHNQTVIFQITGWNVRASPAARNGCAPGPSYFCRGPGRPTQPALHYRQYHAPLLCRWARLYLFLSRIGRGVL